SRDWSSDVCSSDLERPERLTAVAEGVRRSGLGSDLRPVAPEPATTADLERVHDPGYVGALERFCRTGGGHLDADTPCRPRSWDAALLAAGAGLTRSEERRVGKEGRRRGWRRQA